MRLAEAGSYEQVQKALEAATAMPWLNDDSGSTNAARTAGLLNIRRREDRAVSAGIGNSIMTCLVLWQPDR
jgi:hypothetical protein